MTEATIVVVGLALVFAGAGAVAVLLDVRPPMRVLAIGVAAAALGLLLSLLHGCVHAPVDTIVRRVDSTGELAVVTRELGRDGWRIVSVTPIRDGWSYVVVLERPVRLAAPVGGD